MRKAYGVVLAAACVLIAACGGTPEQSEDGTWPRPSGWSDVSQNLLNGVYDKDPKAAWWGRITAIEQKVFSDDNYISMRVNTNYRLNEPADVIEATNLCNAMVTSIPREGWGVEINGIITEGLTNADGSIETADYDREEITFGESWNEGATYTKHCQARALFSDVVAGLKADGWTEEYIDDEKDPAKVFEGAFIQDGDIYFKDVGTIN